MKQKFSKIWEKHYIKIIIAIVVLGLVITIGAVVIIFRQGQEPRDTATIKQEANLSNSGISEEQQETMSEPEKEYYESGEDVSIMSQEKIYADDATAQEYTGTEEALSTVIALYADFDYEGVVSYVSEILQKANLTEGQNTEIAALYLDASSMTDYDRMENSTKELILTQHRSPISLAVDTIHAYHQRRNAVIIDMASVSPYFTSGTMTINSYSELESNSEEYQRFANIANEYTIKHMWKIDMSFPLADGYCIAIETGTGDYMIVGYYGDELANNYSSQSYWNSLGRDVDRPSEE